MDPKNTLYILDMDRTLTDVGEFMLVVEKAVEGTEIDFEEILDRQKGAEQQGFSYDPMEFIDSYGPQVSDLFQQKFVELAEVDKVLFPDGARFLGKLKDQNLKHIVLTQGFKKWQELKLRASKLDQLPYIVTPNSEKGFVIEDWINQSGHLVPPGFEQLEASSGVLVDDKLAAFMSLPDICDGYLINRAGRDLKFADELPENIKVIDSLDQVQL